MLDWLKETTEEDTLEWQLVAKVEARFGMVALVTVTVL